MTKHSLPDPTYDEFASWREIRPEFLNDLPNDLATSLRCVHRASQQAAFVRYFIGSGSYLEKPIADAEKIYEKLFDDLRQARQSFAIVEREIVAVRQQVPSAIKTALNYAERILEAANLRHGEKHEGWPSVARERLKSIPALDGDRITETMKAEVVDAEKNRIKPEIQAVKPGPAANDAQPVGPRPVVAEKPVTGQNADPDPRLVVQNVFNAPSVHHHRNGPATQNIAGHDQNVATGRASVRIDRAEHGTSWVTKEVVKKIIAALGSIVVGLAIWYLEKK